MSAKGKSVMQAIKNLDAFYSDLGLLIANFENMLGKRGFAPQGNQPNRATFSYALSTHISRSNQWTLKCIERMYLKEDEVEQKSTSIRKAILCSLAMFPTSAFEMPVLVCGTLSWDVPLDPDGALNHWPTDVLSGLVEPKKKNWRLKDPVNKDEPNIVYRFAPLDEVKNIEDYSVFLIDLVKIESSKVLEEIVNALIDLYNGVTEISINPDILVDTIPRKLMEIWLKPTPPPKKDGV